MTTALTLHDAGGILIEVPGLGVMLAFGKTVPADASAGYCPGCLFLHIDGAAGTFLYCNEGTGASSDFDAVTVA